MNESARLTRWTAQGALALADQALFSGTGLAIHVLLARWLEPAAYGAFAVGFAIILLMAGPHNALIIEPMSVLGPARYADRLGRYIGMQVVLHLLVMFAVAAPLAVVGALVIALKPA